MEYITIIKLDTIGMYIARHPEFPTILVQGDSPSAAETNLVEATEMAICHLIQNKLPVPEPMYINTLKYC